jgi:sugar phosphate isomerase/epimerase
MQLGLFAKTFAPASLSDILDAEAANGLKAVHYNMACVGRPSMPDEISAALTEQIRRELVARQMTMVGISGTYNMIHPDPVQRAAGLRRLAILAAACRPMGTSLITLCTGTRDPYDQWRFHPDNDSPAAWRELTAELANALEIADTYDLTLGVEPEIANVVNSAAKAQKLLAEMQSERLKIVIDPANILPFGTLPRQRQIMDDAFDRLGADIVMAHAKDTGQDGQAGDLAAGTGLLDFTYYLAKLRDIGFGGPLVMHGLSAEEVPTAVQYLQKLLDGAS